MIKEYKQWLREDKNHLDGLMKKERAIRRERMKHYQRATGRDEVGGFPDRKKNKEYDKIATAHEEVTELIRTHTK